MSAMATIDHSQAQEYLHIRKIDLSEGELQDLQNHLAGCAECRQYAASLEHFQREVKRTFHTHWDAAQPKKSGSAGVLIRWGKETVKARVYTAVGTTVGVLTIIGLIIGLDFIIRNLRAQPVITTPVQSYTPTLNAHKTKSSPTASSARTNITFPTNIPESSIVLNWGYSIAPLDSQGQAWIDRWVRDLSKISGLHVVAKPGPTTDMEILKELQDGEIQMAILDAMPFIYGQEQGWVVPGPVLRDTYQPDGRLMFVARKDSDLLPGKTPQINQQFAGKHPCWPELKSIGWMPVYEYIVPSGLFKQYGVGLGSPIFIKHSTNGDWMEEAKAVYLKQCDFAVFESEPVEGFMSIYFPGSGITPNAWRSNMQVLFYTPPIVPYKIMAFSSQLEPTKRELLSKTLLKVPMIDTTSHWSPYNQQQNSFYDQFRWIVDASGADIGSLINNIWDPYLNEIINATPTP